MAGLQSSEGRMVINSVVWAQYINVTDRQSRRHIKCLAKLCIVRQKLMALPSHVADWAALISVSLTVTL